MQLPPISELAAAAATMLALVSMAPQVSRLWRTRDASGVALSSATIGIVSEAAWVHYTLGEGLWSAVPESVLATSINVILAVAVLRTGVARSRAAAATAAWAAVVLVAGVAGPSSLGALLAVAYTLEVVPSVWAVHRTSAPTGVAAGTWVMVGVECVLWGVYGLAERDPALLTLGCVGTAAAGAILLRLHATRVHRAAVGPQPATAAA
jgi:uncharacterized protein with PQ loop repeat